MGIEERVERREVLRGFVEIHRVLLIYVVQVWHFQLHFAQLVMTKSFLNGMSKLGELCFMTLFWYRLIGYLLYLFIEI